MRDKSEQIPFKVSEYIKENFKEDFLFEVKEINKVKGHVYYTIEVTKDNYIHTLRFNEYGRVVNEDADPAFPPDMHEEPAPGTAAE